MKRSLSAVVLAALSTMVGAACSEASPANTPTGETVGSPCGDKLVTCDTVDPGLTLRCGADRKLEK